MSSSVRPSRVRFDADSMWVELSDGRTIGVPLVWFPRLLNGTADEREQVTISCRGLHWEALDEDMKISRLRVCWLGRATRVSLRSMKLREAGMSARLGPSSR